MKATPPRDFGPFQLGRMVARSAMAEVYEGHLAGHPVAVKQLLPELCDHDAFCAYFQHEQRLTTALHHPNIVGAIHTGTIEGTPFLALDFVKAPRLVDILCNAAKKEQQLSTALALHIGVGIATALAHAHLACDGADAPLDVVHMDIAPHNVFVEANGQAVLFDFGIARSRTFDYSTGLDIPGRAAYWAPEQLSGIEQPDARSDVFALGVILYEMLTLEPLFRAASPLKTAQRVMRAPIADLAALRADCSTVLAEAITRALARDPDERYANGAEFLADLHRARLRQGEFPSDESISAELRALYPATAAS